jgi:hypothetical protein
MLRVVADANVLISAALATTTSSQSIPTSSTSRSSPLASSSIASTEGGDADDYPQSILTVGLSIARSGRSALVPL